MLLAPHRTLRYEQHNDATTNFPPGLIGEDKAWRRGTMNLSNGCSESRLFAWGTLDVESFGTFIAVHELVVYGFAFL